VGKSDKVLDWTGDPDKVDELRAHWAGRVVDMGVQEVWGVRVRGPVASKDGKIYQVVLGRHDEP
jgi:hypothetical protein